MTVIKISETLSESGKEKKSFFRILFISSRIESSESLIGRTKKFRKKEADF